jgi:redox-sensitive bicupin YhaK (pirin superfamily)
VETLSPLFYVELIVRAGATVDLAAIAHPERALLVLDGAASLDGEPIVQRHLVVLDAETKTLRADSDLHAIVLGGAPLDGPPRHAWWNFVSSSKERIEQAKQLWRDRGFARIPGDDSEFVPLPD